MTAKHQSVENTIHGIIFKLRNLQTSVLCSLITHSVSPENHKTMGDGLGEKKMPLDLIFSPNFDFYLAFLNK